MLTHGRWVRTPPPPLTPTPVDPPLQGDSTRKVLIISGRAVLYFSGTTCIQKHKHIKFVTDLLNKILIGWDASCFRIGKATGLKALKTGENRLKLHDIT